MPVIVAKRAVEEIFLVFSKILAKNAFQFRLLPAKKGRREEKVHHWGPPQELEA